MDKNSQIKKRRVYEKPAIVHQQKVEALAAACDSAWVPSRVCMVQGSPSCQRVRF